MSKRLTSKFYLATLAAALLGSGPASADIMDDALAKNGGGKCDIHIQDHSRYAHNKYDSLSSYDYLEPLDIRVTHKGRGRCRGILNFERGASDGTLTGTNGDNLKFLLLDSYNTNAVLFNPQTGQTNGLYIDLKAGNSMRLKPYFHIQRRQPGQSGSYTAPIDMVFSAQKSSETRRQALNLRTKVKASVQANFTGVLRLPGLSGLSLLNLGNIQPGQTKRLGLQLRSNSDVDVTLSSRHNGSMKNVNYEGEFLRYDMIIGGQQIDLSDQDSLVLGASVSRNGITAPVDIIVENFDSAAAGRYVDVVEVRVSAR